MREGNTHPTSRLRTGGLLYNVYQPPPGFDMSEGSADQPFCDDPSSPSYNVPALVDAFVAYAQQQAGAYRGNDILLTMGSDFNYENADTVSALLSASAPALAASTDPTPPRSGSRTWTR